MASINVLTHKFVQAVAERGKYRDGPNLYLRVGDGKRWVFIYQWQGKSVEMGLGSAGDVKLADVRDAAEKARAVLRQGVDPRVARKASEPETRTFWEVYETYRETKVSALSNAKHRQQWTNTLATYAAPLRDRPVDSITAYDVLGVLKPIWNAKPETASRVRGRIEAVLDAAKVMGLRSGENPATWKGNLAQLLPAPKKLTRGHHRALAFVAVPEFMKALRGRSGVAARALEFAVLTTLRTREVIGARWDEIDWQKAVWIVPAGRMKAKKAHRVPLSPQALALLRELQPLGGDYVFPGGPRKAMLSTAAMDAVLKRMKVDGTVHGFRSTFRDWAGETTDHAREVIEAALAHEIGSAVERAYRRGDVLEKRMKLMCEWADYLDG